MSKSPSLRRIQADIRELAFDPSDRYHAAPMENDMFEWHFTIRGADGTEFEGGMYHGRILLPPEYPMRPPNIVFLTPSGRFETNTKICLSFSAFHPELWQPAWGIRLILEALISFLPTPADGAIGALDWSAAERKKLAAQSVHYECPICGKIAKLLPEKRNDEDCGIKPSRFQKEIEELQRAQQMQHALDADKTEISAAICRVIESEDAVSEEHEPEQSAKHVDQQEEEKEKIQEKEKEEEKEKDEDKEEEEVEIVFSHDSSSAEHDKSGQTAIPSISVQPISDVPVMERTETEAATSVNPTIDRQSDLSSSWFLSDPVLHAIMLVLSMTCYLLLRKIDAVMEEIYALENQ